MADITAKAQILGANQASDRPISFHCWDVAWNDVDAGTGDTILLPDKFDKDTVIIASWGQVLAVSNGTVSNSVNLQVGTTVKSTGVFTSSTTPWTAVLDTLVASGNIGVLATGALLSPFRTVAGQLTTPPTTEGQFRLVLAKGGTAGTARPRVLVTVAMGRVSY